MKKKLTELQKLRGVGEVLSRRLVEAGYDTFAGVAAAGDDALKKIPGINPRMVPSIVEQARQLADEAETARARKVEALKRNATVLKEQVQGIALRVRDEFPQEAVGKAGRKVENNILKLISSLEKVEGKLGIRVKRAGKGLAKAEKRLAALAEAGLVDIGRGLKKARKSLKRILS
jgi:Holliday junction resolvasome RuvABC DNA-binding subunit